MFLNQISLDINIFELRKNAMFKTITSLLIGLLPLLQFAQDFSDAWKGHYSYLNVKQVVSDGDKLFAASDNAVFTLDLTTNEIEEISTVNGLSGDDITAISYSEDFELLLIGYSNGLIEIVFDDDSDVLPVVDILNQLDIAPGARRINHFNINENIVYVATDFGISEYNLERLEFGDTFLIGDQGTEVQVSQTTLFNGFIYASSITGIRRAEVSNASLIDFNNWSLVNAQSFTAIETNGDRLYALGSNRTLYDFSNEVLTRLVTFLTPPNTLSAENGNLSVATSNIVFIYDTDFQLRARVPTTEAFDTVFSSAVLVSGSVYVGTRDFGVLKTSLEDVSVFEELHPDSPLLNIPFAVTAEQGEVWVTYGEYTTFLNPFPLNSRGFSRLTDGTWGNTNFSEVFGAQCLNGITVNPFDRSQVFVSSYFSGLLELNEGIPSVLYNESNSNLRPLVSENDPERITNDIRVGNTAFDEDGLLWTTTNLVIDPLKSYDPSTNTWVNYDISSAIGRPFDSSGFTRIEIDNTTGTKFISSIGGGVVAFNENSNPPQIKSLAEDDNIPNGWVRTIALDNENQLWIGTLSGLRVLFNASAIFDDGARAEEIIIAQEDGAAELLFEQLITDIEVDGANNKWVATLGAGLFYFSPDGQNTIFHFTKDNSPLPSNFVNDVSVDLSTGEVYIATDKGLLSFTTGGTGTREDFSSSRAYPNPVRPGFNITEERVKITDLADNINIKIVDIEGNLVAEAQSGTNRRFNGFNLEIDGGTAFWNGKNLANNVVTSGVYLIMLSDLDAFETKVIKLLVVR